MLITPLQLEKEPLLFDETIPAGRAGVRSGRDPGRADRLFTGRADLLVEHRGHHQQVPDIRLRAAYMGTLTRSAPAAWSRFRRPCAGNFDLIFRPQAVDADAGERSITPDETEIGYYEESGLSLEDVVREQVLLSLPSRTLCNADCKGLCPRCGQNLNLATCNCNSTEQTIRGGMRFQGWRARSNPGKTKIF